MLFSIIILNNDSKYICILYCVGKTFLDTLKLFFSYLDKYR